MVKYSTQTNGDQEITTLSWKEGENLQILNSCRHLRHLGIDIAHAAFILTVSGVITERRRRGKKDEKIRGHGMG
jgi:hypothetical protein